MYCHEPFEHFEVKGDGDVHICCPGVVIQPIGNLLKSPVWDIWNSYHAKEIRKSILNKSYKYCNGKHCALVKQYMDYSGEVTLKPDHNVVMTKGPGLYNLGYDRACNLACRSCRNKFVGHNEISDTQIKLSEKIQSKLIDFGFKDAKRLVVTGSGDPFASKIFSELFENINLNKCPEMKIRIFTNAMLLSEARWGKLAIKDAVDEIFVSIDAATKDTYEYLRRGAKFETLLKRLSFISQLKKNDLIKRFRISFVVQKDNYTEMEKFVELGNRIGCDIIYFSAIRNWGTFSQEDFMKTAVHELEHPEHQSLLSVLSNECFKNSKVNLNTLQYLLK